MKTIEQDLLKELLNYDPETGVFTWCEARAKNKIKAGDIAGSLTTMGYTHLCINYTFYYAHRLAWVYTYGSIPEGFTVDHKNGIRDDNRLENLRLATQAQQTQNNTMPSSNTSGYVGVSLFKRTNKWSAQISINSKKIHLGYFNTPEAANDARIKAKAELHLFNPIQRTS